MVNILAIHPAYDDEQILNLDEIVDRDTMMRFGSMLCCTASTVVLLVVIHPQRSTYRTSSLASSTINIHTVQASKNCSIVFPNSPFRICLSVPAEQTRTTPNSSARLHRLSFCCSSLDIPPSSLLLSVHLRIRTSATYKHRTFHIVVQFSPGKDIFHFAMSHIVVIIMINDGNLGHGCNPTSRLYSRYVSRHLRVGQ